VAEPPDAAGVLPPEDAPPCAALAGDPLLATLSGPTELSGAQLEPNAISATESNDKPAVVRIVRLGFKSASVRQGSSAGASCTHSPSGRSRTITFRRVSPPALLPAYLRRELYRRARLQKYADVANRAETRL